MTKIVYLWDKARSPIAYKLLKGYLNNTLDFKIDFRLKILKSIVYDFFIYFKKEPRKSVTSLTPLSLFLIILKNYSTDKDIFYNI